MSKVESKRDAMPMTAEWIDRHRIAYGAAYVNDLIRRANAGEPGLFYAIEGGHVLGTAFAPNEFPGEWQAYAVMTGCKFAGFIKPPKVGGGADGAS